MSQASDPLRELDDPSPGELGASAEEWLARLQVPTWLRVRGRDTSRCRALVTLLHGNEPSGVRALHGFLRSGAVPAVNLVAFVGAVDTALGPPTFARRNKPSLRDLNRCFAPPFSGEEGRTAQEVLRRLRAARPEALVDVHNTSGRSPSYGVSTGLDPAREALTSLFAEQLIITEQRLGALFEATEKDFPTVVIECGAAGDPAADEVARSGLPRYLSPDVLPERAPEPLTLVRHPIRVQIAPGTRLVFAAAPDGAADLTLHPDLEQRNFGRFDAGEALGWAGERGLECLDARDGHGRNRTRELFAVDQGRLRAAVPLRPLMVTPDPVIAAGDCLCYVVEIETS